MKHGKPGLKLRGQSWERAFGLNRRFWETQTGEKIFHILLFICSSSWFISHQYYRKMIEAILDQLKENNAVALVLAYLNF